MSIDDCRDNDCFDCVNEGCKEFTIKNGALSSIEKVVLNVYDRIVQVK